MSLYDLQAASEAAERDAKSPAQRRVEALEDQVTKLAQQNEDLTRVVSTDHRAAEELRRIAAERDKGGLW